MYTIKTPNDKYNGITEGVPFVNGVAEVKDVVTRDVLVNNYGYMDETKTEEPAKKGRGKASE
ncbi:hypothetical protein C0R09_18665 [Brevibacillus laterosporus]|uniref:hypothetical protein n=1 Tax=Brevibacillus laterosporus TaxID=1465 RepID=UPI000C78C419|nr:hypothetical protein [Brevibacillus laterosporus]AUM66379.1 hypothetical protein C0R09_18665 [Brevibacillus laterosporus]